jgi:hypothetical protein
MSSLQHILETAFFASLEREDGHNLKFLLCCVPSIEVRRDGTTHPVPVIPLRQPRPLTVATLRSAAPAVSSENAAILVRCPDQGAEGPSEIAGVLSIGSHLARGRTGRAFYRRPAPYALMIDVRDAGEMHIYRGATKLATLKGGRLEDQLAFSGLEFLPISGILAAGGDVLRREIRVPAREAGRETSDFEWTALLNTILAVVNGIKEHGHGGTLLLTAPGSESSLPVRVKFDVDDPGNLLTTSFLEFVNARHELIDRHRVAPANGRPSDEAALSPFEKITFIAEEALADAADVMARLSAVDGAVVMTSDLRLVGFGAEIVVDASRPVTLYEATGETGRSQDWPEVDSESFGMRHRSALRCVAVADNAAAFVVSQDGAVSFFWKQHGRVLLKRDVGTANSTMLGISV